MDGEAILARLRARFGDRVLETHDFRGDHTAVLAREAIGLDRPNIGLMDMVVRRNAFGRQVDSFEADLPVKPLGEAPYHAIFIRAPTIEGVGPNVDIIACLADGTAVAAREGTMVASSFHPELTDDTRFHEYFLDLVRQAKN